ncbi:MoaD/ThiS family protein [Microbacterium sp. SORGH_AS_0888]|uniref:MoaD/ThiS family protein n=1 Tax=Microbacterium sp. SORGH_AS_0888 TaxID=3041791 RepID=UPI002785B4FB|nr:MoaD/ThiS family protein [Microbacterium sp. SORGH_AS_0888]MDQ1128613.1 molybdopterin synthase sulfur carrier subunit [Microbacterium sp. SORGH_AS_0888]
MTPQISIEADTTVLGTIDVTVRFFAAAKAEAGCAEGVWHLPDACTVDDAIARAGFGSSAVFGRSSFLLNGRSATRAAVLGQGDVLDVLPPFAGG